MFSEKVERGQLLLVVLAISIVYFGFRISRDFIRDFNLKKGGKYGN